MKICIWPDNEWCYHEDIDQVLMITCKSDDYITVDLTEYFNDDYVGEFEDWIDSEVVPLVNSGKWKLELGHV